MKFLIIDKSPDIRASVKRIIDSDIETHSTVESSNYDEAFFHLYSISPDYIIMDPESLNGSGMMLLKSCIALLPSGRIFVFTELSTDKIKNKLSDLGVKNIFSKSSDTEQFIKKLSLVLSTCVQSTALQDLSESNK